MFPITTCCEPFSATAPYVGSKSAADALLEVQERYTGCPGAAEFDEAVSTHDGADEFVVAVFVFGGVVLLFLFIVFVDIDGV